MNRASSRRLGCLVLLAYLGVVALLIVAAVLV